MFLYVHQANNNSAVSNVCVCLSVMLHITLFHRSNVSSLFKCILTHTHTAATLTYRTAASFSHSAGARKHTEGHLWLPVTECEYHIQVAWLCLCGCVFSSSSICLSVLFSVLFLCNKTQGPNTTAPTQCVGWGVCTEARWCKTRWHPKWIFQK